MNLVKLSLPFRTFIFPFSLRNYVLKASMEKKFRKLIYYIVLWTKIGLKRTGKSCRLRWLNYLHPDVRRGNITLHEQLLILQLHSIWGNRCFLLLQSLLLVSASFSFQFYFPLVFSFTLVTDLVFCRRLPSQTSCFMYFICRLLMKEI